MKRKEIKTAFDRQIKELSGLSEDNFGYIKEGREESFKMYLKRDSWDAFIEEMKNSYSFAYSNYKNSFELKEKEETPPRMASIASSSRFIYLSFRDEYVKKIKMIVGQVKEDGCFQFEHKMSIEDVGGGGANVDASYITTDKGIYFEAKCHELFDSLKLRWREAYFKKDGVFFGNGQNSFNIDPKYLVLDGNTNNPLIIIEKESGKEYINYQLKKEIFNIEEKEDLYLDIKQFVCHLLGIANDGNKKRELIYLYFKPAKLEGFECEYCKLEKQFRSFCECKIIESFCKKNNISIKLVYAINNSMTGEFEPTNVYSYDY